MTTSFTSSSSLTMYCVCFCIATVFTVAFAASPAVRDDAKADNPIHVSVFNMARNFLSAAMMMTYLMMLLSYTMALNMPGAAFMTAAVWFILAVAPAVSVAAGKANNNTQSMPIMDKANNWTMNILAFSMKAFCFWVATAIILSTASFAVDLGVVGTPAVVTMEANNLAQASSGVFSAKNHVRSTPYSHVYSNKSFKKFGKPTVSFRASAAPVSPPVVANNSSSTAAPPSAAAHSHVRSTPYSHVYNSTTAASTTAASTTAANAASNAAPGFFLADVMTPAAQPANTPTPEGNNFPSFLKWGMTTAPMEPTPTPLQSASSVDDEMNELAALFGKMSITSAVDECQPMDITFSAPVAATTTSVMAPAAVPVVVEDVPAWEDEELLALNSPWLNCRPGADEPFMVPIDIWA